jgi:hypothetical protein
MQIETLDRYGRLVLGIYILENTLGEGKYQAMSFGRKMKRGKKGETVIDRKKGERTKKNVGKKRRKWEVKG